MIIWGPHYEFTVLDDELLVKPLDNGSYVAAVRAAGIMAVGDDNEEIGEVLAALGEGMCELWCTRPMRRSAGNGGIFAAQVPVFDTIDVDRADVTEDELGLSRGLRSVVTRAKWLGERASPHGPGFKQEKGIG